MKKIELNYGLKLRNMKKTFIYLIFFLFYYTNIANAQEYVPIPDNHIWSVNCTKYKTCGDTVINDKGYLKVYAHYGDKKPFDFDLSEARYYCALRNDTINKRVYAVYFSFGPISVYECNPYSCNAFLYDAANTTEFLLYDFSLNVGDTVSIYEFEGFLCKIRMKRVEEVTLCENLVYSNTDSTQVLENGDLRKRILLSADYPYGHPSYPCIYNTAWIEGVGSIHGLTKHFIEYRGFDVGDSKLLCYAVENELLLSTPWNINNNCHRVPNGGNINENKKNIEIIIYPNPASGFIKIKNINEGLINNCWIEIFDVYGKMVLRQKYEDIINISALRAGYYFVKISDVRVNINSKGFVKF